MKLKTEETEDLSMKPKLAGSQGFFEHLPDDGRESGKGKRGFWMCLCFCLLNSRVYFSNEFLFSYCDGNNREKPPGNQPCEGSLANWPINIGVSHIAIFWFEMLQPKTSGNLFRVSLFWPSVRIMKKKKTRLDKPVLLPSCWAWVKRHCFTYTVHA